MKKLLFTGALFFAVVAGLLTWRAHRQAAEAEVLLHSLSASRRLTEGKLRAATARLAKIEKSADDLRSRLKAMSAPAQKKDPPTPAPRDGLADPARLIADNPHLQLLQSAARLAQLAITYGPFYRAAGLTTEQIAAFERNLLNREERQADIFATANANQTSLSDPAYQKLYSELETEYQSAQRTALGDTVAKQFADYERTAPVRETVSALAGAAAMAGLPLDAAQAEQLTRAIVAVKADQLARAAAASSRPGVVIYDPPVDWRLVHEQAKTFLSPSQLTFIETTEPSGPRGSGGRFLPALQTAIFAAAREDAATPGSSGSP